jgi:hypothetical protein
MTTWQISSCCRSVGVIFRNRWPPKSPFGAPTVRWASRCVLTLERADLGTQSYVVKFSRRCALQGRDEPNPPWHLKPRKVFTYMVPNQCLRHLGVASLDEGHHLLAKLLVWYT